MEEKIYALRNSSFWYDDEFFFNLMNSNDHIGHITAIFEDKEQAIQEWKRLEYEFTHKINFNNFMREDISFNIEEILPHRTWNDLKNLDIEELFTVLHHNDIHAYYLYEYPKQIKQGVAWDNSENNYHFSDACTEYDFRKNYFIDATFIKDDPLLSHVSPSVDSFIFILYGSLSDLSDTPILLSQLIQQEENLNYDEDRKLLRIKQLDSSTLNSLNALLKDPIQCLNIEEIYEIEKSLNQNNTKEA
ncbi:hypothetical protein [Acinetobacter sp. WCHA45]|uniref:hypothetical protein n=1 Tax=Acinetobacter sp. WCHA45 TaxID=2004644 RepID=UPI000B3D0967|nr:hypothetical protein [Acinetobacter sp. WCHA45]AVZ86437.1 hypothetical protein CDG55_12225 [Acinetobacter sp. WCHA45]